MSVQKKQVSQRARRFALTIAYDGTRYAGWQRQKNGSRIPTIQACLERSFERIVQQRISVTASGRTDAGVHARAQVAHVSCVTLLSAARVRNALNALLPDDIRIMKVRQVSRSFHARYSCRLKTYRYRIYNHPIAPVFERWCVWHIAAPLRVELMADAGAALVGTHDFSSFQARDKVARPAVRTVARLSVTKRGRAIVIDITADGFVYTMVRSIVGTLVEIGRGKLPAASISRILNARDRARGGPTAPARGLMLYQVYY